MLRGTRNCGPAGRFSSNRLKTWLFTAVAAIALLAAAGTSATAETRALNLYNIHTKEKAIIVFKRSGVYDRAGLARINDFMRDWRAEKPKSMDPALLDLVWEAYRRSGSKAYIHVVCGYRSPQTNSMLRRRSKGVARNSLHMSGKALDFYIPDVKLAKLREIGLTLQNGGIGFYPASGAPFVHMDTGSVRHWPRMSRQQLARLFPDGKTLHVPSDGKPLPGYSQALAAYKARKASGGIAVASLSRPAPASATPARQVVAATTRSGEQDRARPTPAPVQRRQVGVAVAAYRATATPMPRLAPRQAQPLVVASIDRTPQVRRPAADTLAQTRPAKTTPGVDFGWRNAWTAPAVPAALAEAMAKRDVARSGAAVPIPPTAVVATIDVNRPLRAAAITTAVLRAEKSDRSAPMPQLLAYAPLAAFQAVEPRRTAVAVAAVPLPQPNPRRAVVVRPPRKPITRSIVRQPRMHAPALLMTALDTQALRLWTGPGSTRQKSYALLTMPDFSRFERFTAKPEVTYRAGFGRAAYPGLRTDRFSGPLVVPLPMIDLTPGTIVAAAR